MGDLVKILISDVWWRFSDFAFITTLFKNELIYAILFLGRFFAQRLSPLSHFAEFPSVGGCLATKHRPLPLVMGSA